MTVTCENCGTFLLPDQLFCNHCGRKTGELSSQAVPKRVTPLEPPFQSNAHGWMNAETQQAGRLVGTERQNLDRMSGSQAPAANVKKCPFCAEVINAEAIKCRFCGEIIDVTRRANAQSAPPIVNQNVNVSVPIQQSIHPAYGYQRLWSPGVAGLLSFFLPGAGQLYKGNVGSGIIWFFVVVIGYAAFIIPGLVLHIICVVNAASGDPYRR